MLLTFLPWFPARPKFRRHHRDLRRLCPLCGVNCLNRLEPRETTCHFLIFTRFLNTLSQHTCLFMCDFFANQEPINIHRMPLLPDRPKLIGRPLGVGLSTVHKTSAHASSACGCNERQPVRLVIQLAKLESRQTFT